MPSTCSRLLHCASAGAAVVLCTLMGYYSAVHLLCAAMVTGCGCCLHPKAAFVVLCTCTLLPHHLCRFLAVTFPAAMLWANLMHKCWGLALLLGSAPASCCYCANHPHGPAVSPSACRFAKRLPFRQAPALHRYRLWLLLRYAPSLCRYCPLYLVDAPALRG